MDLTVNLDLNLNCRGMKPEVRDVVYVVDHDDSDDDRVDENSSSMLVVNNVPVSAFSNPHVKSKLESMFLSCGHCKFDYIKSLKRVEVTFNSLLHASAAKTAIGEMRFEGCTLHVFNNKKMEVDTNFLAPPKPKKMMLISPPSSPPDGWEQAPENNPAINYELIAALAGMAGDAEEIELQAETDNAPKLIVQSGP